MYTVETSLVMIVIFISLSLFLTFSFKFERKVADDFSTTLKTIENEYKQSGKKKFKPEKIQRIIKNINYVLDNREEEK